MALDPNGKTLYNAAGEADSQVIEGLSEKSLAASSVGSASK